MLHSAQALPRHGACLGVAVVYIQVTAAPAVAEQGATYETDQQIQDNEESLPMKIHVEVYLAAHTLAQHKDSFTPEELRREIERRFGDTRPGVQTHISAHCVANAPRNAGTVSNYLWRRPNGRLRLFDPDRDRPDPTRRDARTAPDPSDLPPGS